jgi:hypothetical protein
MSNKRHNYPQQTFVIGAEGSVQYIAHKSCIGPIGLLRVSGMQHSPISPFSVRHKAGP